MTHSRNVGENVEARNRKIRESIKDRLLTVNEVAYRLSVGRTLVYKLMEQSQLAYVVIGRTRRVRIEDVNELISNNRIGGNHVA